MSGSEAKAIRRDIRRSFGPSAFDEIVGMRAEIALFNDRVKMLSEHIGKRIGEERTLNLRLADDQRAYADMAIARSWRARGFLGRLRWLMRGR